MCPGSTSKRRRSERQRCIQQLSSTAYTSYRVWKNLREEERREGEGILARTGAMQAHSLSNGGARSSCSRSGCLSHLSRAYWTLWLGHVIEYLHHHVYLHRGLLIGCGSESLDPQWRRITTNPSSQRTKTRKRMALQLSTN
jgi:hypothetical protein